MTAKIVGRVPKHAGDWTRQETVAGLLADRLADKWQTTAFEVRCRAGHSVVVATNLPAHIEGNSSMLDRMRAYAEGFLDCLEFAS